MKNESAGDNKCNIFKSCLKLYIFLVTLTQVLQNTNMYPTVKNYVRINRFHFRPILVDTDELRDLTSNPGFNNFVILNKDNINYA